MLLHRLACGALLLAAPLLSSAQTAPAAPAPRFYVGLAAYDSNYQNMGRWQQKDTGFRVPVQLTVGYQLRPRLALELGAAYSGFTSRYADNRFLIDEYGTPYEFRFSNTTTARTTSVTALARYTLTRQPAHRLQLDVLGGFTLVHRAFYSRGFEGNDYTGGALVMPEYAYRSSSNDLLLTAGLGLRYQLCPRFALNFDLTTNHNLNRLTEYSAYRGFTGSMALGVRYRFGK